VGEKEKLFFSSALRDRKGGRTALLLFTETPEGKKGGKEQSAFRFASCYLPGKESTNNRKRKIFLSGGRKKEGGTVRPSIIFTEKKRSKWNNIKCVNGRKRWKKGRR